MELTRIHGTLNSAIAHNNSSAKSRVIYVLKICNENLDLLTAFFLIIFFGIFFNKIFDNLSNLQSIIFFVLYILLICSFVFIIYKRKEYLLKLRFGGLQIGGKIEKKGVYIGDVLYENFYNMPNFFTANDSDLIFEIFSKNKDFSNVDLLVIGKEENISKYLSASQKLLPIKITDIERIKKIYNLFKNDNFKIEDNKFLLLLIEDIFLLQSIPQEISYIIKEGYKKGIRIIYGGARGVGDFNAFLLEKDIKKNVLISRKML